MGKLVVGYCDGLQLFLLPEELLFHELDLGLDAVKLGLFCLLELCDVGDSLLQVAGLWMFLRLG